MAVAVFAIVTALVAIVSPSQQVKASGPDDMIVEATPSAISLGSISPVDLLGNVNQQVTREFTDVVRLRISAPCPWTIRAKASVEVESGSALGQSGLPSVGRLAWRAGNTPFTPFEGYFTTMFDGGATPSEGVEVPIDLRILVNSSDPPLTGTCRISIELLPRGLDGSLNPEPGATGDPVSQMSEKEVTVKFEIPAGLRMIVETPMPNGGVELTSAASPDHAAYMGGPSAYARVRVWSNYDWKLWVAAGGDLAGEANLERRIPLSYFELQVAGSGGASWASLIPDWARFSTVSSPVVKGGPTWQETGGWAVIDLKYRIKQDWLTRPGTYRTPILHVTAANES